MYPDSLALEQKALALSQGRNMAWHAVFPIQGHIDLAFCQWPTNMRLDVKLTLYCAGISTIVRSFHQRKLHTGQYLFDCQFGLSLIHVAEI